MKRLLVIIALVAIGSAQTFIVQNYDAKAFQFTRTSGSSAVASLGTAGAKTAVLTPCPKGITAGSVNKAYVYISGGTGTAEPVLVTSYSLTATSCTIGFTTANTHSGAWTISSASGGIQEAVTVSPNGGVILIPDGTTLQYAPVTFAAHHEFIGRGRSSIVDASVMATPSRFAFEYASAVQVSMYDVVSSMAFKDFYLKAKNGILINTSAIPTYQGNILGVKVIGMRMNGTYGSAVDANKNTNVVPLVSELTGYGVGFRCNQCFQAVIDSNQIENFGIGVYYAGDESTISNSRIDWNGWQIYIDGGGAPTLFHGNTNVITANKIGAILRMGGIVLNQAWFTSISANYFESYCPSAQFIRSDGSLGTKIIGNRMDDPNNSALCPTGAANSTPIFNLDDYYGIEIAQNFLLVGGGAVPPMALGTTHYEGTRPNIYHIHDNAPSWPEPTGRINPALGVSYPAQPAAVVGLLDPNLFRERNIGGSVSGYTTMPWTLSGTTNRYVLAAKACCWVARFYMQNPGRTEFHVRVTARKTSGAGTTFVQVQYIGTGTTTVYSGNLTISATSEVETQSVTVTIPAGESMAGRWEVAVDNTQAEIEQIEIVPVG